MFLLFRKPILTGVATFFFLVALTQFLSYETYLLLKDAEMRDLNNAANSAKERMQTVLSYNLSTAQTLGFIVEKYGIPENFDSVGAALLRSNKFVDIVQLVEGGVITHVFPLKGNEAVIGYNILKDSVRSSGALAAIKARDFFWAGPLELKQGGVGIIGRQPLFKNNQFKGFSAVIIKLPTFLHAVGIDSSFGKDFYYQFSRVNDSDGKEQFFLGGNQSSENVLVVPVKIPNSEWRLYVARKNGNALFLTITLSSLGFVISIIGGLFAWYFVRQPEQLSWLVKEKTRQLSEASKANEATLNRITDAVLSLDKESTITFINRTAQLRLSRNKEVIPESEILGKKVWDVYNGVRQTLFYEKYQQALQTQKELEAEGFFEPTQNWVLMKMYPAEDGVTIYSADISERMKAETEIRQSQQELRQLSAHLQTIREEERTSIAREIHDELGQQLTGLKMDASWLSKKISVEEKQAHEKLESMISLMDDTVKTIRRISSELRPGILDDLGLIAALEWQSSEFEKRSGISCSFKSYVEEIYFERNLATGIFRVYQETLTNVVRHSKATAVESTLAQTDGKVILTIKDNGEGFDTEAVKNKKTLGLLGMKERALMFGGELILESMPEGGTTVILKIPLFSSAIQNKT